MGTFIEQLDTSLKNLNLGVSAWVNVSQSWSEHPNDPSFWIEEIGYDKIGNKWGIAIRSRHGREDYPEEESCKEWLFDEAPRKLRLSSVEKIPELLEDLTKQATATTEKIKDKIGYVRDLATAISPPPSASKGKQTGGRQ